MTVWDGIGIAGFIAIVAGVAWVYPPAGAIVAGAMMLSAAVIAGMRGGGR